jgi:hypothetical protein
MFLLFSSFIVEEIDGYSGGSGGIVTYIALSSKRTQVYSGIILSYAFDSGTLCGSPG